MKRHPIADILRRFACEENGPTATEYAVLLAFILLAVIASVTTFGFSLGAHYSNIRTSLFG